MHNRDRLRQIRVLSERLERLPASPERDWMLGEVRRRAVDVESGVRPIPVRPLVPEVLDLRPEPPRAARVAPKASVPHAPRAAQPILSSPPARTQPARPLAESGSSVAAAVAAAAATSPAQMTSLEEGLRLCLDDDVVGVSDSGADGQISPWARGLRG